MIDLHTHSKTSDGSLDYKELIDLAKSKNIKYLSITDHDTVKNTAEAVLYGKLAGIKIIPGIELSCYDYKKDKKVHILGYYINYKNGNIENFTNPLIRERDETSRKQIEILKSQGYQIDESYIEKITAGGTGIYKQHIMASLIKSGYTESIYGELYDILFKDGGIANLKIKYFNPKDAVRLIVENGGVAVLAHPGLDYNYIVIEDLVKVGLAGIELKHTRHSMLDEKRIKYYSEKYNLVLTGGSDFHGDYGEGNEVLGSCSPGMTNLKKLYKISNGKSYEINFK
jgi:hypothetical protein